MSEDQTLDYYELLGVPVNASHQQIKNAYRQLAMEWHPDRNADAIAPDAMLLLNEAWEVLGNEKLRADYDRQRALARSHVAEAARQRQRQKTEKAENGGAWSSGIVEPPWYRPTEDEVDRTPKSIWRWAEPNWLWNKRVHVDGWYRGCNRFALDVDWNVSGKRLRRAFQ